MDAPSFSWPSGPFFLFSLVANDAKVSIVACIFYRTFGGRRRDVFLKDKEGIRKVDKERGGL